MATPINLASASPRVIKAWCKLIKVDCLNDLFKSNKIEAAHFFVNSKDAANARKKMLSELGINALQIAAINKNIETTEATFEYDEAVDADVIGSVSPCRDFTSYLSPSSVARSVISHYPAGFLDYSETEFRDQTTGRVTHVNKKSKISPKHYSEWQRNRKPQEWNPSHTWHN